MPAIIETKNLTKRYGPLVAVDALSLSVAQGAIYGFVGPNGAGKTTTMRMMTTLLRPTSGEAWIAGASITRDPRGVRRAIGYMPDFFGVYDDMKVWEYLDFFAACYEIPEAARKALINDLLELVDLNHRRDDMVDTLSRGMKQRLCLARTLAHDPQILILDEPASGLDPRARIEIRELLLELSRLGKTIFFSTHILADVAEICTQVGIVEAGQAGGPGQPGRDAAPPGAAPPAARDAAGPGGRGAPGAERPRRGVGRRRRRQSSGERRPGLRRWCWRWISAGDDAGVSAAAARPGWAGGAGAAL